MPVMDANSVMVEIKGCGFSHLNSKVSYLLDIKK